jgi:hypothetical protein
LILKEFVPLSGVAYDIRVKEALRLLDAVREALKHDYGFKESKHGSGVKASGKSNTQKNYVDVALESSEESEEMYVDIPELPNKSCTVVAQSSVDIEVAFYIDKD